MEEYFTSNNNLEYTNQDIRVKFTPDLNAVSYSLKIMKDGKEYNSRNVSSNAPINIALTETGNYQIIVTTYDIYNNENVIKSDYYNIDKDAPKINVESSKLEIKQGTEFDFMNGITAYDSVSGNITDQVKVDIGDLDTSLVGNNKIVYTVSDQAGNVTTKTTLLTVNPAEDYYKMYFAQGLIIIFLALVLAVLMFYRKSIKKERRIAKYSLKSINEKNKSIFDSLLNTVNKLMSSLNKALSKSEVLSKQSQKFQKYTDVFGVSNNAVMEFISRKVLIGVIFSLVAIITQTIRLEMISFFEILITFFVGYFVTNLYYIYKYYLYRNEIENNLLQAITLMNNAFKSGRSIIQAIEIAASELEGPISLEFKKMSLELSVGLEVEEVFRRFANRIKLEEAVYLTSSLSILNKTGGNLIKVFSSIEKTLYNRKRLKIELRSLTGSSKMIMYTLMVVPIFFVLLITMIYPSYFLPLVSSPIGYIVIFVILLLYIVYIVMVRKIMNIRM